MYNNRDKWLLIGYAVIYILHLYRDDFMFQGLLGGGSDDVSVLDMLARWKVPHCLIVLFLFLAVLQVMAPIEDFRQAELMLKLSKKPAPVVTVHNVIYSTAPGKIFGDYFAAGQQFPITTLPLLLQGVGMPASAPNAPSAYGWAIISNKNGGAALVYKVGDQLAGGALLTKVSKDEVVIKNSGRLERLVMKVPLAVSSGPLQ